MLITGSHTRCRPPSPLLCLFQFFFSHSIPFAPCASHVCFPLCRSGLGTNASETQGVVGNLFCYCLCTGHFSSRSSNDNNNNFISMQRDSFPPSVSFVRIFYFIIIFFLNSPRWTHRKPVNAHCEIERPNGHDLVAFDGKEVDSR